jgi:Holliday junction resolvase RusA-like endonuclease
MIITLPWPDSRLNPNQAKGMHWTATANVRKNAKASAYYLTMQALRETGAIRAGFTQAPAPVPLTITFVQPDRRARDRDNLLAALKSALDGVAQALKINDSEFEPIVVKREYGGKPGSVIVEIA